ncbi:MAG: hypothetical protein M1383_02240 [Patescibacteria group bacterium]|nr:hypothetical protein [Patescibacteria group bacterium]
MVIQKIKILAAFRAKKNTYLRMATMVLKLANKKNIGLGAYWQMAVPTNDYSKNSKPFAGLEFIFKVFYMPATSR